MKFNSYNFAKNIAEVKIGTSNSLQISKISLRLLLAIIPLFTIAKAIAEDSPIPIGLLLVQYPFLIHKYLIYSWVLNSNSFTSTFFSSIKLYNVSLMIFGDCSLDNSKYTGDGITILENKLNNNSTSPISKKQIKKSLS